MSETIDNLKKKTALRAMVKNANAADIEKIISHLQAILEERAEAEAQRQAELAAKKEAIDRIIAAMKEADIDINDLSSDAPSSTETTTRSAAPKYAITDSAGVRHEWSGRGRTPKVFDEYMRTYNVSKNELPAA